MIKISSFEYLSFKVLIIYYCFIVYFLPDYTIKQYSLIYFMIVLPILIYIIGYLFYYILNIEKFINGLNDNRIRTLIIYLFFTIIVSVFRTDFATVYNVFIFTFPIIIIINRKITLTLGFLNKLYFCSVIIGIFAYYLDINLYGYFPGQNKLLYSENTYWRISIFPNVVDSSFFSFFILILNILNKKKNYFSLILSLYFFIFSGQRTLLIVFIILLGFLLLTKMIKFKPRLIYRYFILIIMVLFILITSASTLILAIGNSGNSTLNSYLFRNEDGFTSEAQVSNSIARVLIWEEHLNIYLKNPIIGFGNYDFSLIQTNKFIDDMLISGSESFLTGLLSKIGLLILPLIYYFIILYQDSIKTGNKLNYILVITIYIVSLAYGSILVPYNFVFLLFFSLTNIRNV